MTNTPTERRLAITPGTWKGTLRYGQLTVVSGDSPVVQSVYGRSPKEAEANATLIADAGTTYNACGLTPSELLAKLREAEELLACARDWMGWVSTDHMDDADRSEFLSENKAIRAFISTLNLPQ